ncbi:MAG: hypothetical protein L6R38_006274 [Xanthoria sp. 2 TBL-2021]|nr:MAG: hypothetical protein L6R38_006274 [Xanthoria sp. 2 TBL-2021]
MSVTADPRNCLPWVTTPHKTTPTTPTTSTNNTQPMPTPSTSSSMGLASTSDSTPACDNLRDAISFRYKKLPPRNVIYLPNQMQTGQQLQMPSQAPVAGIVQPQQQQVAGLAQQGIVGQAQQPGASGWQAPPVFQTLPQEQQQALQHQLPTSTSADPVRYTTWGPKTVYYVDNLPSSESSKSGSKKKKSNRKAKKNKEKKEEDIMFQKVILNGSEQMQTTEKIEVLGPEQGGGIKKTWVCVTKTEVVSVEKQVEEKDVVVESSDDEESSSGSEDTSDDDGTDASEERQKQKVKKAKEKGGKGKQVAVREVREEKKKKKDPEKAMEEGQ